MRWVRPAFTTSAKAAAFSASARARWRSAGTRSPEIPSSAARWMAEGKVSFEDCPAFTSSFGLTRRPIRRPASVARTSFRFMFVEVPEPVWKTSTGKASAWWPAATSSAAAAIASATSLGSAPRRAFTRAAAPLMRASARTSAGSTRRPEIGKFSTARWVCAPHSASRGTATSPIESCSIRNPSAGSPLAALTPGCLPASSGTRPHLAPNRSGGCATWPNAGKPCCMPARSIRCRPIVMPTERALAAGVVRRACRLGARSPGPLRRRRTALLLAAASLAAAAWPLEAHASPVTTLRTRAYAIAARIDTLRLKLGVLSEEYDQALTRLGVLRREIRADRRALGAARSSVRRDAANLRRQAIEAYVNAGTGAGVTSVLTSTAGALPLRQAYLEVASASLDTAIASLRDSEHRLGVREATLAQDEAQAAQAADTLRQARDAALGLEAQLSATLSQVQGQLAAAIRQQQVAQAAAAAAAAAARRRRGRRHGGRACRREPARRPLRVGRCDPGGRLRLLGAHHVGVGAGRRQPPPQRRRPVREHRARPAVGPPAGRPRLLRRGRLHLPRDHVHRRRPGDPGGGHRHRRPDHPGLARRHRRRTTLAGASREASARAGPPGDDGGRGALLGRGEPRSRLPPPLPPAPPAAWRGGRPEGTGPLASHRRRLLPPSRRLAGGPRDPRGGPRALLRPARLGHRPRARARPGEPEPVRPHGATRPGAHLVAVAAHGRPGAPGCAGPDAARLRAGRPRRRRRHARALPVALRAPAAAHGAPRARRGRLRRVPRRRARRRRRAQVARRPRGEPRRRQPRLPARRALDDAARRPRRRGPVLVALQAAARPPGVGRRAPRCRAGPVPGGPHRLLRDPTPRRGVGVPLPGRRARLRASRGCRRRCGIAAARSGP